MASIGSLTGAAKLGAVTKLLDSLTKDLESQKLTTEQRAAALDELKVYGRDPRDADPIFTKEGITTLTRYAFDVETISTSQNALKCLANSMLIKPGVRHTFVELGCETKACALLKRDTWDDEFLLSRVIFLTTYGTKVDLEKLIDEEGLAETVIAKLAKHASLANSAGKETAEPMRGMALSETLKLLFNVSHFCKAKVDAFTPAVPHVVTLIKAHNVPASQPLEGPLSPLINALVNLNLDTPEAREALYPEGDKQTLFVDRLIHILDLSMDNPSDEELQQTVTPLLAVIRLVYEQAPDTAKTHIRGRLLPTADDRQKVLGRGKTVPAKLLRNCTNALTPQLRDIISHLLFELSDKDAHKFVENVGYGYASGFLFQNNIPVPQNATSGDISQNSSSGRAVNPITGQFLDQEIEPQVPEMTDEEKEREAERLFVLFERLKKTGIIDVQNPVEQAFREGRFQDIKDDDRIEELD
ncbi:guanine nucleotide exchange factor [Coniella lustricola]|uniref:Guanine nucleotide exchange factor n=1 Tax=Coniella lustricola TaxID=2025994 RepID=A0A2T3A9C0_9PEZI|nr:guanine nucleotide exchange factor [Coniella lustricola]